MRALLAVSAALLTLGASPSVRASPQVPRAAAHPDVQGEQDCAACHRTRTPGSYSAWEGSAHGLALVKCVVCHGSTGTDFRAKPKADRCRGCHAALVEARKGTATKDCFACHAPHSLSANPHRSKGTP